MLWAVTVASALASALAGCAAFDAQAFDRSSGWHAAEVVAVGRADALAGGVDRDCGGPGGGSAPYAVVRYRNGGVHTRSLGTARLPAGTALRPGDEVHVNILDCAAPLVAAQSGSSSGAPPR
jgi:hypothetical protein